MEANLKRDRFFKGQHPNEEFVCFFRHHWIVLLRDFLYFFFFTAVLVFSILNLGPIGEAVREGGAAQVLFVILFILGTFFYHRFFIGILDWFLDIGIITNYRIVDHQKTLFLRDTFDSLDVAQIQNVEKLEEGLLPSMFHYGDIKIFLTASDAVKTFHAVPNANFHFRCLNRQKERRREELQRRRPVEGLFSRSEENSERSLDYKEV